MTIHTDLPGRPVLATESRRARRIQSFLERGWPIVLAMAMIGAVLGGYYGTQRSDDFVAQATVFVSLDTAGSGTDINQGAAFIQSQMPSYAELARTQLVLQPVVEELSISGGIEALRSRVEVDHPPETAILTVSVYDPSRDQAVRIANGVVDELRAAIVEAADPGGDNIVRVDVDVVDVPLTAADVRGDDTGQLVLVLGLGGALLGLLLLAVAAFFDRRVRGEEDVRAVTDAPVLTRTATGRGADTAFELLSIAQGVTAVGDGPVTWAVLPAGPEADTHTVARGLIASRSSLGDDVIVLDVTDANAAGPLATSGRPSTDTLDPLIGTVATHNPGRWESKTDDGRTALKSTRLAELGWDVRRPDHLKELMRWAAERGHSMVLVLGPMDALSGTPALAARADAVILTVQRDRTRLKDLSLAVDHLRVAGDHLVAVVMER